MNCGRHGFWPAMRAGADRRRVTNVSPVWLKAPCASFSGQEEIKPHKVRYYLERRDAEFEPKIAEVLCLPRGPGPEKEAAAKAGEIEEAGRDRPYDEKPRSRPSPRRHQLRQCQAAMPELRAGS